MDVFLFNESYDLRLNNIGLMICNFIVIFLLIFRVLFWYGGMLNCGIFGIVVGCCFGFLNFVLFVC